MREAGIVKEGVAKDTQLKALQEMVSKLQQARRRVSVFGGAGVKKDNYIHTHARTVCTCSSTPPSAPKKKMVRV